jgi:hypothetical protein
VELIPAPGAPSPAGRLYIHLAVDCGQESALGRDNLPAADNASGTLVDECSAGYSSLTALLMLCQTFAGAEHKDGTIRMGKKALKAHMVLVAPPAFLRKKKIPTGRE